MPGAVSSKRVRTEGEKGILMVRINKYLSEAGFCSRRKADELIEHQKVTIDGRTAVIGDKVAEGQKVMVDGQPVKHKEKFILLALNKPRGIVCTASRKEKDNVIDFINYPHRIYPIGRLDRDSEGLLLLTNQGDIADALMRAGDDHEKEYLVKVNKPVTKEFLSGLRSGVPILDTVTRPCKVRSIDKYTFEIILTQGLNRQIRRMCEYFDYKVVSLKRTRIMCIQLGSLKTGKWRHLTRTEAARLMRELHLDPDAAKAESGQERGNDADKD